MESVAVSVEHLNVEVVRNGPLSWVNVERPGTAEMAYLRQRYDFHQLSLDDCLSVVQMPKLDEFDDHLFMVMHFPQFDEQSRITQPSEVDVFAGSDYIVTVHSGDLRPLVKLFSDCRTSEEVREDIMGRGSGYLLYRVLDSLVDYSFPILRRIMANVDDLERRVFETFGQDVVRELALIRRDILSFRRLVRPQIEVLEELEERDFEGAEGRRRHLLRRPGGPHASDTERAGGPEGGRGGAVRRPRLAGDDPDQRHRAHPDGGRDRDPAVRGRLQRLRDEHRPALRRPGLVVRGGHGAERRRVGRAAGAVPPPPLALSPARAGLATGRTR